MARLEPYVHVEEVIKDFPTLLSIDGSANIGCTIVSAVGPQLAYIDGPNTFLKTFTKDGVTVPRDAHISWINAYYMSFFAGLVVARSMNSSATGGLRVYNTQSNALKTYATYFKDGVELVKKNVLTIAINSVGEPAAPATNYAFILDDIVYYGGDKDTALAGIKTAGASPASVDLSAYEAVKIDGLVDESQAVLPQILDYLASDLNKRDVYTVIRNNSTLEIYRDSTTEVPVLNTIDIMDDATGQLVSTQVTPFNLTTTLASETAVVSPAANETFLFNIIDKTPGSIGDNPNKVTIGKQITLSGHKVFTITLQNGVNDPEDYVVSLDPEAVDFSEVNCYIEGLNSMQALEFQFQVGEGVPASTTWTTGLAQTSFGAGFIDKAASASTAYLKQALDTLEDQELYQIAYLAPVGITSVPYIKTYLSMGKRNKWFAPVDVPFDRTNVNAIQAYGNNIDDDYNTYMVGPFDKNTGLTGWVVYIAATTLYYERVMNNRAARSEFAPVFDQNTGLLAYTSPVKLLKKSAREQLISLMCPINYVIYNQRNGSYYLNDNWTHYSKADNIMGEECNVRMVHKISRDLQSMYQQFKAKYNSASTRREVVNLTQLYFANNIMNQVFRPEEFMVICDESNNTADIINSHKLAITVKVRLYKSIKYIEVINEVYSVGGASFEA